MTGWQEKEPTGAIEWSARPVDNTATNGTMTIPLAIPRESP